MIKKFISGLAVGALIGFVPVIPSSSVSAAVVVTPSKSTNLVDGEQITLTLSGIPATQGVYVRQGYKPTVGQRDTTGLKCNGSLKRIDEMIWATMFGARGSQSASGTLTLPLKDKVVVYEADGTTVKETISCGIADCAIFVHRDHMGLQDTTLDTVVPLTFLGKQSIKARLIGLPKSGAAQTVGSSLQLKNSALVTDQGSIVRISSKAIPKIAQPGDFPSRVCTVVRGATATSIRFVKKGTCVLELTAKATGKFERFTATYTYTVG
jgi:hypothetical protein